MVGVQLCLKRLVALYIQLPAFTKYGHYARLWMKTIHLVEVRTLELSPFFRTVCIW